MTITPRAKGSQTAQDGTAGINLQINLPLHNHHRLRWPGALQIYRGNLREDQTKAVGINQTTPTGNDNGTGHKVTRGNHYEGLVLIFIGQRQTTKCLCQDGHKINETLQIDGTNAQAFTTAAGTLARQQRITTARSRNPARADLPTQCGTIRGLATGPIKGGVSVLMSRGDGPRNLPIVP